ncbi:MAG TPA: hypothetical protein PLQ36_03060 [Candidatus Gracilibacteria bacterium]|nr:hypothetical protein [Candidatus Gracilibacteria bacterium]
MEVVLSKNFIKMAKKLVENNPKLKTKINSCIIDFAQNGKESIFFRKNLKGNLSNFLELQIGGDIRCFIRYNPSLDRAVFEKIGTHSQLNI